MSGLPILASAIRQESEAAESAWHEAVAHAVRAGELLIEVKSRLGPDEWAAWLAANFPGSERPGSLLAPLNLPMRTSGFHARLGRSHGQLKAAISEYLETWEQFAADASDEEIEMERGLIAPSLLRLELTVQPTR